MVSDDYTPSTENVRLHYVKPVAVNEETAAVRAAEFGRWLASVEAAAEQRGAEKERERIARNIEEANAAAIEDTYDRGADYGMKLAARITREGA